MSNIKDIFTAILIHCMIYSIFNNDIKIFGEKMFSIMNSIKYGHVIFQ